MNRNQFKTFIQSQSKPVIPLWEQRAATYIGVLAAIASLIIGIVTYFLTKTISTQATTIKNLDSVINRLDSMQQIGMNADRNLSRQIELFNQQADYIKSTDRPKLDLAALNFFKPPTAQNRYIMVFDIKNYGSRVANLHTIEYRFYLKYTDTSLVLARHDKSSMKEEFGERSYQQLFPDQTNPTYVSFADQTGSLYVARRSIIVIEITYSDPLNSKLMSRVLKFRAVELTGGDIALQGLGEIDKKLLRKYYKRPRYPTD
jgi:hypothetical protein